MKHETSRTPLPKPETPATPAPRQLTISTPLALCFLLLMALPWPALFWLALANRGPAERRPAISARREGLGAIHPGAARYVEGPWGLLKIEPIIVEPPSSFFGWDYDVSPSRSWIIANATPEQAADLLARSGMDRAAVGSAMKTASPDAAKTGQILRPPDDVIRALSPQVRAALYGELAKNPANSLHATPFAFRGESLQEWFANSDLDADIAARVEPLLYRQDRRLCFTDIHLVLPAIESPMTRIRLLRTLHRAATYSLRVQRKPGVPLDSLLNYWGRGGRSYQIEPALQSMDTQVSDEGLDVSYLLPDFARTRLYTYINPTRGDPSVRRDCHWTSFNFFNDLPDNRYGKLTDLTKVTQEEYVGTKPPAEFGDLIFFIKPPSAAIHSCVFIADDIVFTKNGAGFGMPFIFERLEDVIAAYRHNFGDISLEYCRRRQGADAPEGTAP